MPYTGQIAEIKFGDFGLMYDLAQQNLPPNSFIRADNVQFYNGIAEKADQINTWVLGNPSFSTPTFVGERPLVVHRYFPLPGIERHLVVTDTGNVYKYLTPFTRVLVTPTGSAPTTLSINNLPVIVEGGNEDQNEPKKLFIFTGNSPIQVVEGDTVTRRNMALPALDWSASYPSNGFVFRNRLCAYGNLNDPHRLYISTGASQEDFTGSGNATISVFSGEGDGLFAAFVFKGRIFLWKQPYGVYYLVSDDVSPSNWYPQRVSSNVGIASSRSYFEAGDDLFFMSTDGTIASFTAAFRLGDIYQADLLANLKTESIFRNIVRRQFLGNSFAKYLPQKKIGFFAFPSFKSADGKSDCFIHIDFNQQTPRISWHRYNESKFTCCSFYKDAYGDDQFLFGKLNYTAGAFVDAEMATPSPYYTDSVPFRIQTPHLDLGSSNNKLFDFFEVDFESTTAWPLAVDVYIDSKYKQTFTFQPYYNGMLGGQIFGPSTPQYSNPVFTLDQSYLDGRGTRDTANRIAGRGKTISFVIRDGDVLTEVTPPPNPTYTGPNPDDDSGSVYPYKLAGIKVYYRVAGQDGKKQTE
jgi:hypothetical protein